MEDKRVSRRGIAWAPRQSHVIEARRCVRVGIPIHPRWLPFLPPRLRVAAILKEEHSELVHSGQSVDILAIPGQVGHLPQVRSDPRQVLLRVLR